ncbi:hypothetical protein [Hwanghaeella sp.]|uniref:hypothetical protein n=1 Tax=Hwanghaeella sp. TaxID=2605943 RepID=UPI003CCC40C1
MRRLVLACAWLVMLLPATALAGKADVLKVAVSQQGETYRFDVTVAHEDMGWDHYADAWEVVGPDGKVLGVRTLFHPHVDEQPFTRSLTGVKVPAGVDRVTVRAHDKVHGWGGKEVTVEVPR